MKNTGIAIAGEAHNDINNSSTTNQLENIQESVLKETVE